MNNLPNYNMPYHPNCQNDFYTNNFNNSIKINNHDNYPDVNSILIPNFTQIDINSSFSNNFNGVVPNNENKYICNFEVQISNDEYFRITKRIIGNKGVYLKSILFDCCGKFGDNSTKIRLRGRGSGFKEGANYTGNN